MPDPYPTPEYGGARYTVFTEDPIDYDKAVQVWEFKDGSAAYKKSASSGILIFRFQYAALLDEEQLTHDLHYNSCFGRWLGFDFYHPRTGQYYQNVHYHKYSGNEMAIAWRRSRMVELIWRGQASGGGGLPFEGGGGPIWTPPGLG